LEGERLFNETVIAEREQGIKQIESTIIEVNEVFRDLGALVQEQGVVVDNIERHIDETVHETTQGVKQLAKAKDHLNSTKQKMCCLVGIIVVVIAVTITALILAIGV